MAIERQDEGLCGDNLFCITCIGVNILVVTGHYTFARYYHRGKLGSEHVESL